MAERPENGNWLMGRWLMGRPETGIEKQRSEQRPCLDNRDGRDKPGHDTSN
jgi:hypothetical protein